MDAGAVEGIAVTSRDNSNGQWQYSTDGITWNSVAAVSQTNALLLRPADQLRFVPDTVDSDTATITFRAWDQTSGVAGTWVDVSANGGTTAFSSTEDTASIIVTAVNDAPVLTVPGTQTVVEETQTAITGISITDSDDRGLTMSTQASVTNGIVILDLSGGATVTAGANSSADVTITGTKTQINAALASLEYLPDTDIQGTAADTLTVLVSDLGSSGTGGALTDTQTVTIDILNVNDEEIVATNTGLTVDEGDIGTTITRAMLETTDVDNTAAELIYTLTAVPATGTLRLNGAVLAVSGTFTQADINAGLLTYDHNNAEAFTDGFAFTVNDAAGTSTSSTFSISITPVNDNDPIITSDGSGATASFTMTEN